MRAYGANARRTTADERGQGYRARGTGTSGVRRRRSGTRDCAVRTGLARMGEREIAALLAQIEAQEGFETTEGDREEIIDPAFDDVPGMWEALGIPDASVRLRSWPSAMMYDGDDANW